MVFMDIIDIKCQFLVHVKYLVESIICAQIEVEGIRKISTWFWAHRKSLTSQFLQKSIFFWQKMVLQQCLGLWVSNLISNINFRAHVKYLPGSIICAQNAEERLRKVPSMFLDVW